jgi:hypothetical protein
VSDVRSLVRVDVRVLDDDLAALVARAAVLLDEPGAQVGRAIEEGVEVSRSRDLEPCDPLDGLPGRDDRLRQSLRRLARVFGQLEAERGREVAVGG